MARLATATGRAIASSDRAREVERQHAGILDQDGVGLADQHGGEGGEHQQDEREALQGGAHLAGATTSKSSRIAMSDPILPPSGRCARGHL